VKVCDCRQQCAESATGIEQPRVLTAYKPHKYRHTVS